MSDEQTRDADRKDQRMKERRKLQKRELKLRERLEEARSSQAAALERFRSAEARLQKRIGRVNKLEKCLQEIQILLYGESVTHEEAVSAPVILPLRISSAQELLDQPDPHVRSVPPISAPEPPAHASTDDADLPTIEVEDAAFSPAEMAELLLSARAAANAAEQSARLAAVRAQAVAARLEVTGSTRHLAPVFTELQTTVARARVLAADASQVADEATRFSQQAFPDTPLPDTPPELQAPLFTLPEFDTDSSEEDEEDLVSALASLMIAEATATAAAHAEAVAEEKSALTEQARRQVNLADQNLRRVRAAITNHDLVDEEAELALQEADNEFTRAMETLANAEKAEDLARRSALNVATSAAEHEELAHATLEQTDLADLNPE